MPTKKKPLKRAVKKTTVKKPKLLGNTYSWNVHKFQDVVAAKEAFDIHQTRGFKAFALDAKGNKSTKMPEFDPSVGAMLFVKP